VTDTLPDEVTTNDRGVMNMDEERAGLRARNRQEEIAFAVTLRQSYEREDERYSTASQAHDWLILVSIGAFHFVWMLVVFLVEPGIR
jgi:hypothetical protein